MSERLKNVLIYGNPDKKAFQDVYPTITENSQKNLFVFSVISAIGMAVMMIASWFEPSLEKNRTAYLVCSVVCLVIALLMYRREKVHRHLVYICMYVFVLLLFSFGIALGTIVEPNELSASFLVIMFAAPLLFTDMPIRMNVTSVVGIVQYTIVAKLTQNPTMFGYNMTNVLPFGVISIIISTYMMQIKIQRYILESQNKFLSESDQLTGMLNRRCFEQYVQALRDNGTETGMLVCELDINGLKMVNDNLGHHAGDELIRGAADCIQNVFGPYGHCYRIGGDEFVAILGAASPKPEELLDALSVQCSCFKGMHVSGLSISAGIVAAERGESVDDLIKQADKKMYEAKSKYYRQSGIDRRKA